MKNKCKNILVTFPYIYDVSEKVVLLFTWCLFHMTFRLIKLFFFLENGIKVGFGIALGIRNVISSVQKQSKSIEILHCDGKTNLCVNFIRGGCRALKHLLGVHGAHLIKDYLKYRREVIKHYRRRNSSSPPPYSHSAHPAPICNLNAPSKA